MKNKTESFVPFPRPWKAFNQDDRISRNTCSELTHGLWIFTAKIKCLTVCLL